MAVAAQSAAQRDIVSTGDGGATLSAAFRVLRCNIPLDGVTLCVWMCVLCVHSGLRWT